MKMINKLREPQHKTMNLYGNPCKSFGSITINIHYAILQTYLKSINNLLVLRTPINKYNNSYESIKICHKHRNIIKSMHELMMMYDDQ